MVGEFLPPPLPSPIEREPALPRRELDLSSLDHDSVMLLVDMIASSHESQPLNEAARSDSLRPLVDAVENGISRLVYQDIERASRILYDMARSRSGFVRHMATSPLGILLEAQCDAGDQGRETTADYLVGILRDQELEQPGELHGARHTMTRLLNEWWLDPELGAMFTREFERRDPRSWPSR